MTKRKRNAMFGRYPCCDIVNNAIRDIRDGETDSAVSELVAAIQKGGGYLHEDIAEYAETTTNKVWEKRRNA